MSVSVPSPPTRMSLPALPFRMFAPVLPVIVFAPSSPARLPPTTPDLRGQLLDPAARREREAAAGQDLVDAAGARVVDDVGDVGEVGVAVLATVHDIGATIARQHIGPRAAGQMVDRVVALDGVGQVVAGTVDRRRAGQGQVLEEGSQRVAHGGVHRVDAAVVDAEGGVLAHGIAGIVDGVGVVAGAAEHRVGAAAAVQRVDAASADHVVVAVEAVELAAQAAVAEHRVGESIALSGQSGAKQLQQFQVGSRACSSRWPGPNRTLHRQARSPCRSCCRPCRCRRPCHRTSCRHRDRRSAGRRRNRH